MDFVYAIFPNENFVDLSIVQFGYQQCDPLHSYGPATRNHFLFHYILSGRGLLISGTESGRGTREYVLEAGQGFLIWPGQHNTYMADKHDPWAYAWIEFDGVKASELVAQTGLSCDYPVYSSQDDAEREKMKDELLFIANHSANPPLELIGHFYLFMCALVESSSMKKKVAGGSLRDFYARESLAYIERHYSEPITVEDIAAACSLDRSYLSKIFKSVMDISPQEFIIRYRVNKACELMKVTNLTIGEISARVGYANEFNFSRAFKSAMGKPPGKWREENKLRKIND